MEPPFFGCIAAARSTKCDKDTTTALNASPLVTSIVTARSTLRAQEKTTAWDAPPFVALTLPGRISVLERQPQPLIPVRWLH